MKAREVRDKVLAWVAAVIEIPTIHGFQDAEPPAEPYAVVHRTISDAVHDNPAGEVFFKGDGNKSVQVPLIETYWRFSVDVFGEDAEDYLQRLRAAANVPTSTWGLRPLALFETSRILTDHEIRNQIFKNRAQMTIEVRGVVREGVVVSTIGEQTPEFEQVA